MYEVKVFKDNYDRGEFYSIMGKYFAERIYRKLLPYLINEKEKVWYLFFENQTLCGFCGVKKECKVFLLQIFMEWITIKIKGF